VKRKDTYITLFPRSFERGQKFFLFLSAATLREHGRNPNSEFVPCRQPECLSPSHRCAADAFQGPANWTKNHFSGLNQLTTEAKGNYFIACRI
jgi:hypothetical protein